MSGKTQKLPNVSSKSFFNHIELIKKNPYPHEKRKRKNIHEKYENDSNADLSKYWIINPYGPWKSNWNLLIGLLVIYSMVVLPFQWGFQDDTPQIIDTDITVNSIFLFDVIISFNTAYKDVSTTKLVHDRFLIFINYLKFWFWIDVISSLPWNSIASLSQGYIVVLFRIFRLFRLLKLMKLLSSQQQMTFVASFTRANPQLSLFSVLVLQICIIAHIFACVWNYVGFKIHNETYYPPIDSNIPLVAFDTNYYDYYAPVTNHSVPLSWIYIFGFQNSTNVERYFTSLYFVAYSMSTVGSGDIHPTNINERVLGIFIMLIGSISMGALISAISNLITTSNPLVRQFDLKLNKLKRFLLGKKLNRVIKGKVIKAYQYYLSKKSSFLESDLVKELPSALYINLINTVHRTNIRENILFHGKSDLLIVDVLHHTIPIKIHPGAVLIEQNDLCSDVYLVLEGILRMKWNSGSQKSIIGFISPKRYFGDLEMTKKSLAFASYEAATTCKLLAISHEKLNEIFYNHQDAADHFFRKCEHRYSTLQRVMHPGIRRKASPKVLMRNNHAKLDQTILLGSFKNKKPMLSKSTIFAKSLYKILDLESIDEDVDIDSDSSDDEDEDEDDKHMHIVDSRIGWPLIWVDGNIKEPWEIDDSDFIVDKSLFRVLKSTFMSYQYKKGNNTGTIINMNQRNLWRSYYFFFPSSHWKLSWDVFIVCLILYCIVVNPVQAAFASSENTDLNDFELLIDISFFIDVVITFRTVIYSKIIDAWIMNWKEIALNYIQGWFLVDFLSCIPYDWIIIASTKQSQSNGTKALQLFRMLRVIRFGKLLHKIKSSSAVGFIETKLHISPNTIEIMKIIFIMLFTSHLVACIMWGLSSDLTKRTWYDYPHAGQHGENIYINLRQSGFLEQYVTSFYWAVTTLTTTGYGDINPVNYQERIMCIFIFAIGATIFGYIIGNIGNILGSMAFNEVSDKMYQMKMDLTYKQCPRKLEKSILKFYQHKLTQLTTQDEANIYFRLPRHLSNKLFLSHYNLEMNKIALFKYIYNDSIKIFLFELMKPQFYDKGIDIFGKVKALHHMYFIIEGRVLLTYDTNLKQKSSEDIADDEYDNIEDDIEDDIESELSFIDDEGDSVNMPRPRLSKYAFLNSSSLFRTNMFRGASKIKLFSRLSTMNFDSFENDELDDIENSSLDNYSEVSDFFNQTFIIPTSRHHNTLGVVDRGHIIGLFSHRFHGNKDNFILHANTETPCLLYSLENHLIHYILENHPQIAFHLQYALAMTQRDFQRDIIYDYLFSLHVNFLRLIQKKYIKHQEIQAKLRSKLVRNSSLRKKSERSIRNDFNIGSPLDAIMEVENEQEEEANLNNPNNPNNPSNPNPNPLTDSNQMKENNGSGSKFTNRNSLMNRFRSLMSSRNSSLNVDDASTNSSKSLYGNNAYFFLRDALSTSSSKATFKGSLLITKLLQSQTKAEFIAQHDEVLFQSKRSRFLRSKLRGAKDCMMLLTDSYKSNNELDEYYQIKVQRRLSFPSIKVDDWRHYGIRRITSKL